MFENIESTILNVQIGAFELPDISYIKVTTVHGGSSY